jgi:hypothetical protein
VTANADGTVDGVVVAAADPSALPAPETTDPATTA